MNSTLPTQCLASIAVAPHLLSLLFLFHPEAPDLLSPPQIQGPDSIVPLEVIYILSFDNFVIFRFGLVFSVELWLKF